MGIISVFLIAISLAMDALAVSVTNGIVISDFKVHHAVKMGLYFGLFQFFMPIAGYMLGSGFEKMIKAYDHWIAFFLLAAIGINMIKETFGEDEAETADRKSSEVLTVRRLVLQAVATSIDALAVGVSFAVVDGGNIIFNSSVIGIVAFVFSFSGAVFGKKMGGLFQKSAERVGGIVLIVIGLKILAEHLI